MIHILDCTLRDGGYYTNWDFDKELVKEYFSLIEHLPIEYVEVGYRSKLDNKYFGEYFYLPTSTLNNIKKATSKKIAIMLDAKNFYETSTKPLLSEVSEYVSLVRIATDPNKIELSLELAREVKELGFEVALNIMYISNIDKNNAFFEHLKGIEGYVDTLNLVDSYGSTYPQELENLIEQISAKTDVNLGFHGHDNLELAFANAMKAMDCGIKYIDSTILGMGRGAGNLKTELILTHLINKQNYKVDLSNLSKLLNIFGRNHEKYKWGTNLAYMVSGAYSLPQKNVMDAIELNRYSLFGVVNQLKNENNLRLPVFTSDKKFQKCILIGGGNSVVAHFEAISEFLKLNQNILIIHATSKHIELFKDTANVQYFAVAGEEMLRVGEREQISRYILEPSPRKINVQIQFLAKLYELKKIDIMDKHTDSPLCVGLQVAKDSNIKDIFLIGFDGYDNTNNKKNLLLMYETQLVLDIFSTSNRLISLTPSAYKNLKQKSIYSMNTK